jgi:hypothetical protein
MAAAAASNLKNVTLELGACFTLPLLSTKY